jgi:hypothetical protein
MTDVTNPKRDSRGRWLKGSTGWPAEWKRADRTSIALVEGVRQMSSGEAFALLSENERVIAMERAQQIARGRFKDLTPSQRDVVLDLVKN